MAVLPTYYFNLIIVLVTLQLLYPLIACRQLDRDSFELHHSSAKKGAGRLGTVTHLNLHKLAGSDEIRADLASLPAHRERFAFSAGKQPRTAALRQSLLAGHSMEQKMPISGKAEDRGKLEAQASGVEEDSDDDMWEDNKGGRGGEVDIEEEDQGEGYLGEEDFAEVQSDQVEPLGKKAGQAAESRKPSLGDNGEALASKGGKSMEGVQAHSRDSIFDPAGKEVEGASEGKKLKATNENRRPVIGVYTHPYYGPGVHPKGSPKPPAIGSFAAASYVRSLQAGGAQVVPIFYDSTDVELDEAFAAVNMVLIPGGFTSLAKANFYYKNAKKLLDKAVRANDGGDYFAIHGTCLGLELLAALVCEEPKSRLVEPTDSLGQPAKLQFTSEAAKNKSLFEHMPRSMIRRLQTLKLTMENHVFGVPPTRFSSNSKLEAFFEVLTTTPDKQGKDYVSTMAAHNYPISATQWHPEKPPFEFYSAVNVPHSTYAVQVSSAVTAFFLREARKNSHKVCKEDLVRMVVDNYKFEFQATWEDHDYDAIYVFPTRKQRLAAAEKEEPSPACQEVGVSAL